MKKTLFVILLMLAACSQFQSRKESRLIPVNISEKQILECHQYQKSVLDAAYTQVKGSKNSELNFVRNVNTAREILGKFDLSMGLNEPKAHIIQNILHHCDPQLLKVFDDQNKLLGKCNLMFSELNFFQALALGLKKYSWPVDLKLEGKKIALDYVTHFSQGDFSLLDRLVALSVLDELSVNHIVNEDLHKEIKIIMDESKLYVEGLERRLSKNKEQSCESLEVIREESVYSQIVSVKIRNLLKRI